MKALMTALLLLAVSLCCPAWEEETLPPEIARDYVEADAVLDELPCDWREAVGNIFRPAVASCRSAEEATLYIASHMTELTGVYYSTERRKPNMNALEALEEKKVSCTGQSVLLVCALRSVGIPARAVCVFTWNHVRGNHTWVEAWVHGGWKMIEFNEKDFNTPWVMESIGLLNPARPEQRVYAAAPASTKYLLYGGNPIYVEDVTERYTQLAQEWYAKAKLPPGHKRLMVDVQPRPKQPLTLILEAEDGKPLATAPSPTVRDDLRQFAAFNLPEKGRYYLRFQGREKRDAVQATSQPAVVMRLANHAE